MVRFKLNKSARLKASLIACAGFLVLAVWGWDLPVATLLMFLLISLGGLLIILALAALSAFILRKIMRRRDREEEG